MTLAAPEPVTAENRQRALENAIARDAMNGWRVQSQSATQATLVKGKHTSHLLHLILTLLTFGLWAVVWIIVAITAGQKSKVLTVDAAGVVRESK